MATPDLARRHPYAVFYGDSIVTGWRGTTTPDHRWPSVVCRRLGWRETTLALDGMGYVRRRGPRDVSGVPTPSATDTTLLDATIRLAPDVIVVCLGANDVEVVAADGEQVRSAISRDLTRLRSELPDTHVVVTTYFPLAELSNRADRIHRWITDTSRAHGLRYVEAFRRAIDGDERLLCDDGVHPNDEGHRVLADLMHPILGRLLALPVDRDQSSSGS